MEHYITSMALIPTLGMQYACRCGELLTNARKSDWDEHLEKNK